MFNEQQIAAYKKISAPASLHDAIMQNSSTNTANSARPSKYKVKRNSIRYISLIAACIAFCIGLTASPSINNTSIDIFINEQAVTESGLVFTYDEYTFPQSRSISSPQPIELLLNTNCPTLISTQYGTITIYDEATNAILCENTQSCSIENNALINWTPNGLEPLNTNIKYVLEINTKRSHRAVILQYDDTTNSWTAQNLPL